MRLPKGYCVINTVRYDHLVIVLRGTLISWLSSLTVQQRN